jgi:RNA polymerase sigma factor (sigma-70 family)
MHSPDSLLLIRRAREGDLKARAELVERYYPLWMARARGKLKHRRVNETADIVDSAIGEVLENFDKLRHEGAFFAWVAAIIKRKGAMADRRERRRIAIPLDDVDESAWQHHENVGRRLAIEEDYERVLDAMLALFCLYPDHMAILYFRRFEDLDFKSIGDSLGRSESSAREFERKGRELVTSLLDAK